MSAKGEPVGAGADVWADPLSAVWPALCLLGLAAWTQEWDFLLHTTSFFAELDPNPFSLFFLSHGRALELCY